jgi:hypothetical protein
VNFSSFWSDLIAGLIGSGVGIFAGLRIERQTARKKAIARDERLVQNLINRLAGKRAFGHDSDIGELDDDADRKRCARSVLDARKRILMVCDEIGEREDVIPHLRDMEADCLAYLDYSEQERLRYAMGLTRLGDRLAQHEAELKKLMPGLHIERPGALDSTRPNWLP